MMFAPVVLLVRDGQEICWRVGVWIRGVVDGPPRHLRIRFQLVGGGTRVDQTGRFSGVRVGRLTKDVIGDARENFGETNAALRLRVEWAFP
ncbi:hypothetical protein CY652_13565 [Burkholderia sp. WAC0059]|nr:hypothetical protein CY652_13565 [Burkholderia sp. WAC0059]